MRESYLEAEIYSGKAFSWYFFFGLTSFFSESSAVLLFSMLRESIPILSTKKIFIGYFSKFILFKRFSSVYRTNKEFLIKKYMPFFSTVVSCNMLKRTIANEPIGIRFSN